MIKLPRIGEIALTLRKTPCYIMIVTAAAFALLLADVSDAAEKAEKWLTIKWNDDADEISKFDALCVEKSLTSFDVLEANGYSGGELPFKGEELLVPESKSDLLATWVESQNRKGGPKPLVTVKLHGVPSFMRGQGETQPIISTPPEPTPTPTSTATPIPVPTKIPPASPPQPKPDDVKTAPAPERPVENMMIIVSGDEIVLQTSQEPQKTLQTGNALPAPVVVSRDVPAPRPRPTVVKPPSTPPAVESGRMMWPVSGGVSSGYGRRGRGTHTGLDMPMPPGTPVVAAMDGVVLLTATSRDIRYRGYGNTVVIDHGNGITTRYAHCSKFNVSKGQQVKQGDVVAYVGRTGRATTDHVHFEVRKNGAAVNPVPYLAPR